MAWTKDQERAIHESGYNIIDSAGAGSGKTAVLSERVRHFIVDKGYRINDFLIVTFTKLAAGEMKDRIRKKLEESGSKEVEFVDSASITTFDGFTNALIKKYHYKLGVSNDFGVVDEPVMDVTKHHILDEMFDREYKKHDPLFERMISKFCFKDDDELKELVLKIQQKIDKEVDKEEYYRLFMLNHYSTEFYDFLIGELEGIIISQRDEFYDLVNELPQIESKKGGPLYLDLVFSLFEDFFNSTSYDDLISNFNKVTTYPSKPRNQEDPSFEICSKKYRAIKKFFSSLPNSKKEMISSLEENKEYVELLMSFAYELDKKQYEYKKEKQVFSFEDIAKIALNLIKNDNNVREELKNQYKMIMIDEYQDTSSIQEEMMSLISNDNLYMVGDIKQSIYAFRNAKSEIFANKYLKYKNHDGGEAIDMNKNFRSRKEVLEDINLIFSKIMTLETGGANYKKDHIIEFGLEKYLECDNENQNNHSEFIIYNKDDDEENRPQAEIEARLIAEDIISKINGGYTVYDAKLQIRRECEFRDFCVIIDRGTEFPLYKKIFTEYQIPLFVEQNEEIQNASIIKIIRSIIVIAQAVISGNFEMKEKIALLSLARSFLFSKTDEEIYLMCMNENYFDNDIYRKIKNIIDENKGLSNALLFDELIYGLDVYHKLVLIGDVEINSIRIDQIRATFKSMTKLDYSFDDFISYLDNVEKYELKITITSQSSSLNSCKIINIHKSKGLEFPIVYFPMLTKSFNPKESDDKINFSIKYGTILPLENDDKVNILKILNVDWEYRENLSEKIRLLYVALTRTREKMIFILPEGELKEKNNPGSFADLLRPLTHNFNTIKRSVSSDLILPKIREKEIERKKIDLKEIHFSYKEINEVHASKDLRINTNKYILEYGTYLHELMEIIDFYNPDLSIIKNDKIKNIISNFFNSPIMKDVKNAKIYKEYEFSYDGINGIIDLFLVYDDRVVLIDYKTKNIDDEHYDLQLKKYMDFLKEKFNKQVIGYLYSLEYGNYRQI